MRFRKVYQEELSVDMTPMLDMVFIMLIFFIVSSSFIKESGVDLATASKSSIFEPSVTAMLAIKLDAHNDIYIDGRQVDIAQVSSVAEHWQADKKEVSALIQSHPEASTHRLVSLTDQLRKGQISQVKVAAIVE